MDNFMDKLAQKFTAQEIIKANTAADSAEVLQLREQLAQYEELLSQMRQIHLENAATAEKIESMVEEAMTKMKEIKAEPVSTKDLEKRLEIILGATYDVKLSEAMDCIREHFAIHTKDKEEILSSCRQFLMDDLAIQGAQMSKDFEAQQELVNNSFAEQKKLMGESFEIQKVWIGESLAEHKSILDASLTEQKSMIEEGFSGQKELLDLNLEAQKSCMSQDFNAQADRFNHIIEEAKASILMSMQSALREHAAKQQEAIIAEMDGIRTNLANRINELKNSQNDFTEIKNAIESQQSAVKETKDAMVREIEDYVHKEDVKVYRNVQAVVEQQGEKAEESMTYIKRQVMAKADLASKMAIVATAISTLGVLIQILIRLGIF